MDNTPRSGAGYVPDPQVLSALAEELSVLKAIVQPVPTVREMHAMIVAAFWASLERNESRTVRPVLALGPFRAGWMDYHFSRPVPMTISEVAKLSVALTPEGALGIEFDSNSVPLIWGIRRHTAFAFVVDGLSPGTVLVRAQEPLVLMRGQLAHRIGPDLEVALLLRQVVQYAKTSRQYRVYGKLGHRAIGKLARRIASRGHGGALLVVSSDGNDWSDKVACGHRASAPVDEILARSIEKLAAAMDRAARADSIATADESDIEFWMNEELAHWRENSDLAIDAIAQLAAVDGAVVLDGSLRVLGFGAKIEVKSDISTIRLKTPFMDADEHLVSLDDTGGTRHQSAIRFVRETSGSTAIVVSQDGPISIIGREANDAEPVLMKHAELFWP